MGNIEKIITDIIEDNTMKLQTPTGKSNTEYYQTKIDVCNQILEKVRRENAQQENSNCIIPDVMLSLPTVEEIEAWAKEHSKIEPSGAEEFGRCWGAIWMRGLVIEKLKGNGA